MIEDAENFVSLVAVGDIMLGDHPICIGHGVGSSLKCKEAGNLFSNVSHLLCKADITFGNLECILSDIDINLKSLSSVSLRGAEKSIYELKSAHFNVVSIANNHVLEHGEFSLKRSKKLLQQHGICAIGVAESKKESRKVFVMNIKGIRIGFLAYCLIRDKTAYCSVDNEKEIIDDVRNATSKVDILIVSMHWGDEFIRNPSPHQVELGHAIIDAGAKIILGHHPHVLQGVEEYNGGIIAYSMGNFVFDMWQKKMRESMILQCEFSKDRILKYDIIPVLIDKYYHPTIIQGDNGELLISQIKNDFLQRCGEDEYLHKVEEYRKQYRTSLRKHLVMNLYKYNIRYVFQLGSNFLNKIIKNT
ncbi:CapA family protein [uncultured Methanolobus sp.]|uniref:CapA family protein n=1 Tax=uncultured Methanolobus sp. TaxID=218300 RepID=UPI002AAB1752|nr:CapA family protein [uncultured Methanolobus sp.]